MIFMSILSDAEKIKGRTDLIAVRPLILGYKKNTIALNEQWCDILCVKLLLIN